MCPDRADDGGVCVARENTGSGATLTEGRFSADDEEFHPRQTVEEPCNTAAQVRNLLEETVRGGDQEVETDSSAGALPSFARAVQRTWRRRLLMCWYRYRMLSMWSVLDPVEIVITQVALWSIILVIIYRILVRLWRFFR